MKKTKLEMIKALVIRIQKQKETCAKERDKLRDLVSNVNDIVESMTEADEHLEDAIIKLEDAIDTMSTYM